MKKRTSQMEGRQLSLALEIPQQAAQIVDAAISSARKRSAVVIHLWAPSPQRSSFREQVIQDLIKTRVIVSD